MQILKILIVLEMFEVLLSLGFIPLFYRYAKLKVDIRIRIAALEHALADFGPCSQHFLMSSVRPPWQRSISAVSHLPYYIKLDLALFFNI